MNKTEQIEIYTDYVISRFGPITATGLSEMLNGELSHDFVTRILSGEELDSKYLWQSVKQTVRKIERDDGVLIFDDTVEEKAYTDENEIMCWHYDHCSGRNIRGLNILNAIYHCNDVSIPVAFEIIRKPIQFSGIKTRQLKRASEVTKNVLMRNTVDVCIHNKLKFKYFTLRIVENNAANAPKILINTTTSTPVLPGQLVVATVRAQSYSAITQLTAQYKESHNGTWQSATLDSTGRIKFTPSQPGLIDIRVTAIDQDGFSSTQTQQIRVKDPADKQAPQLAWQGALLGSTATSQPITLTGLTALQAHINEQQLLDYQLQIAPAGSDNWQEIGRVHSMHQPLSVSTLNDSIELAQLNPADYANGVYQLRLSATDLQSRVSELEARIVIDTANKAQVPAQATDHVYQLGGHELALTRLLANGAHGAPYDVASNRNDFGNWTLPILNTQLTHDQAATTSMGNTAAWQTGARVWLSLPGQNLRFTLGTEAETLQGSANAPVVYHPVFTSDQGWTLKASASTVLSDQRPDSLQRIGSQLFDAITGLPWVPQAYTLTAPDGTVYQLDATGKINQIQFADQSLWLVSDAGIVASNNQRIDFKRNEQGQIEQIIGNTAQGTLTTVYRYNAQGQLILVRDIGSNDLGTPYGYDANGRVYSDTITANLGGLNTTQQWQGNLANDTTTLSFNLRDSELQSTIRTPGAQGSVIVAIQTVGWVSDNVAQRLEIVGGTILGQTSLGNAQTTLVRLTESGLKLIRLTGLGEVQLSLSLAGDLNLDGDINGTDSQQWTTTPTDLNGDGTTNSTDRQILYANYGYQTNRAPVANNNLPTVKTHTDLGKTQSLSAIAQDFEGDDIFWRILSTTHGTATLSRDGQNLVFTPETGYAGQATITVQADDGFSMSNPIALTVNVSDAKLLQINIERLTTLNLGNAKSLNITGDFADEQGVQLTGNYLQYTSNNSNIASINSQGVVTGKTAGNVIVHAKARGIEGVNVFTVDTDPQRPILDANGFEVDVYPLAITLPTTGQRQLKVTLPDRTNISAQSAGTRYFISDASIAEITPDGLIHAKTTGSAKLSIINGGMQHDIVLKVVTPVIGTATIAANEGVAVQDELGNTVMVAPGTLPAGANISIQGMNINDVGMPLPAPDLLDALGAFKIEVGDNKAALPMQLAIKVNAPIDPVTGQPQTLTTGTEVFFWCKGYITDTDGTEHETWWLVDNGQIGDDGVARTASPPFFGLLYSGVYLVTSAYDNYNAGLSIIGGIYNSVTSFGQNISMQLSDYVSGAAMSLFGAVDSWIVKYTQVGAYKEALAPYLPGGVITSSTLELPSNYRLPVNEPVITSFQYDPVLRELTVTGKNFIPAGQSADNFKLAVWLQPRGLQLPEPTPIGSAPDPRGLVWQGFEPTRQFSNAGNTTLVVKLPQGISLAMHDILVERAPTASTAGEKRIVGLPVDSNLVHSWKIGTDDVLVTNSNTIKVFKTVKDLNPITNQPSSDHQAYIWEINKDEKGQALALYGRYTEQIVYSDDGTLAFIAGAKSKIYVYDTLSKTIVHTLSIPNASNNITSLAVIDDWLYVTEGSTYSATGGRLIRVNIDQSSDNYLQIRQVIQFGATAAYGFQDMAVNKQNFLALTAPNSPISLVGPKGNQGTIYVLDVLKIDDDGVLNEGHVVKLTGADFPVQGKGYATQYISAGTREGEFIVSSAKDRDSGITAFKVYKDQATGRLAKFTSGSAPALKPDEQSATRTSAYFRQNIQRAADNVLFEYEGIEYALVADYNLFFNDMYFNADYNWGAGKAIGGKIGIIQDPFGKKSGTKYLGATTPIVGGIFEHLSLSMDGKLYADVWLDEKTDTGSQSSRALFVWNANQLIQDALAAQQEQVNNYPVDVKWSGLKMRSSPPVRINGGSVHDYFGWIYGIGTYTPPGGVQAWSQNNVSATQNTVNEDPSNNIFTDYLGISDDAALEQINALYGGKTSLNSNDEWALMKSAVGYAAKTTLYTGFNLLTGGSLNRAANLTQHLADDKITGVQYALSMGVTTATAAISLIGPGKLGTAVNQKIGKGWYGEAMGALAGAELFTATQMGGDFMTYKITGGAVGKNIDQQNFTQLTQEMLIGGGLAFLPGALGRSTFLNQRIHWVGRSEAAPYGFKVSQPIMLETGNGYRTLANTTGDNLLLAAGGKLTRWNPVTKQHETLLEIPKAGSLTFDEANQLVKSAADKLKSWIEPTLPVSEQAFQAAQLSNTIMIAARNALQDTNLALKLNIYLPVTSFKAIKAKLGKEVQTDGKTLSGDDLYYNIIKKSEQALRTIGCFVAGTLVHTKEGLRPIEQIKVGDYVLSKPEIGFGELSYKRVVNTFEYEDKEVWYIEAWMPESQRKYTPEDKPCHITMLAVTGNHPFWVSNAGEVWAEEHADEACATGGWIRADELLVGMRLKTHDGRVADVKEVKKLVRMGAAGYGWYSAGHSEYTEYGWVVNVDGQKLRMCSGILPGKPELVPLDPNAKSRFSFKQSLFQNEAVDWQSGSNDIYLTTKVYNLEVEDNHTYFVDHMGVWVHNAGDCEELLQELATKVFKEVKQYNAYVKQTLGKVETNVLQDLDANAASKLPRWADIQRRTLGSIYEGSKKVLYAYTLKGLNPFKGGEAYTKVGDGIFYIKNKLGQWVKSTALQDVKSGLFTSVEALEKQIATLQKKIDDPTLITDKELKTLTNQELSQLTAEERQQLVEQMVQKLRDKKTEKELTLQETQQFIDNNLTGAVGAHTDALRYYLDDTRHGNEQWIADHPTDFQKLETKLDAFISTLQRNSAQIAQRDRQPIVFLIEDADGADLLEKAILKAIQDKGWAERGEVVNKIMRNGQETWTINDWFSDQIYIARLQRDANGDLVKVPNPVTGELSYVPEETITKFTKSYAGLDESGKPIISATTNKINAFDELGELSSAKTEAADQLRGTKKFMDAYNLLQTWAREQLHYLTAEQPATTHSETIELADLMTLLPVAKQYWINAGASENVLDAIHLTIAELPAGIVGQTQGDVITLSGNGAGWGWFVDPTASLSEEFIQLDDHTWQAAPNHEADGKLDLLSVLIHELGHRVGMEHHSDGAMEAIIQTGQRQLPSADEIAHMQAVQQAIAPRTSSVTQSRVPQYAVTANPALTNPEFVSNTGWSTAGTITFINHSAMLTESPVVQTRLNQVFVLNETDKSLRFTLRNIQLDDVNAAPDDAFEMALLNANTGTSLLGSNGLSHSDAALNIQANGTEHRASQVSSTLNADGSRSYVIDLSSVAAGTVVNLSFDLIGFGSETSHVTVTDLTLGVAQEAHDDSVSTTEDSTLTFDARHNDIGADVTGVLPEILTNPNHGQLTLNADGSFAYTPEANWSGQDSFIYQLANGSLHSNAAHVTINVTPVNDAPVAQDGSASLNEDGNLVIDLRSLGLDVDSTVLTAQIVAVPAHGTLTQNADCTFTYAPTADFNGTDSIRFKLNDGELDSNEAQFTFTVNAVNDAPTLGDQALATNEDTVLVGSLLAIAADIDSTTLTARVISTAQHGQVVLNADGSFTYTPDANYNGTDSFTYQVNDGELDSNVATVSLSIAAVNDAPIAQDGTATLNEDGNILIDLRTLGLDIDSATLAAQIVVNPTHGTLTQNADGTFTYAPNANYNGVDVIRFKLNDGELDSNEAQFTFTVNAVNDAPTLGDQALATNEDTVLVGSLLAIAADIDSTTLTARVISTAQHGQVVLNADGSFTYTPDANYNGTDSFTYQVNDGELDSDLSTVSLTIAAVNDAPVAQDGSASLNEDGNIIIDLRTLGLDIDSATLTAQIVVNPAHGTLTQNADGTFTYAPNANYNGVDAIRFKLNDGELVSNEAQVTFTVNAVNDAPTLGDQALVTNEDTVLVGNLLAVAADIDSSLLTARIISTAQHGSLVLNTDGSFTYTPDANYNGTDSFTYQVNDGELDSNVATVSLSIAAVNDAPVAQDGTATLNEDGSIIIDLRTLGLDIDSATLTAQIVVNPTHGTLTQNADGTFTYAPNANYNGVDAIRFKLNDGELDSNEAQVTFTVNAVNDAPTLGDQALVTNEDTVLVGNLLAVAADIDSSLLTARIISTAQHGSLVLNTDGSFSYTPDANFNGSDSFTYQVNDGELDSNVATVSLTIAAVNDAPVAQDGTATLDEDGTIIIDLRTLGLDIDSTVLTTQIVATPAHGTLTQNADGTFTYAPTANYNGMDVIRFKLNDGELDSNEAQVTITVNAVNDAPTLGDQALVINEDIVLTGNLLAVAADIDSTALTARIVSTTQHGQVILSADGSFTYTPDANFNGTDSFTYQVNDGELDSNIATVSLTITAVNDAPTLTDQTHTLAEDHVLSYQPLTSAFDIDGDTLAIQIIAAPQHGSLIQNSDGSYRYTPDANYFGTDSYTYRVNDGQADSNIATVTFTITPVNDAPVASNSQVTGIEDTPYIFTVSDFALFDIDSTDLSIQVNSLPIAGLLQYYDGINWQAVVIGQSITLTDIAAGNLCFGPDAHASALSHYASFAWQVSDGQQLSNSAVMDIMITPVADQASLALVNLANHYGGTLELITTSWESVANRNTNSTVLPKLSLEGWQAMVHHENDDVDDDGGHDDDQNDDDNHFIVWSTNDKMKDANNSKRIVKAAVGNGNNWIEICNSQGDGHETYGIERQINTLSGAVYTLNFDYAGHLGYSTEYTKIGIYLDNVKIASYANTSPNTALNWQALSFSFTGNGSSQALRIVSEATLSHANGRGAMIDDIHLAELLPLNTGYQNTPIQLSAIVANLQDTDGSETLSLTVSDLPVNVKLSDGTRSFTASASNNSVDITSWTLTNLSLTPVTGFTGTINLMVNAISTETANGDRITHSLPLTVTVLPSNLSSPIVLDLNGDGIHTTALANSQGKFDLLNTGSAIHSGWLSQHDGFLAMDANHNGKIDNRDELFGGHLGEGFAKLAKLDNNHDGVINQNDSAFNELKIWQDKNSNQQTDAGELYSLAQANIASLNLNYRIQPEQQNGNWLLEHGTAHTTDGRRMEMVDAYFDIAEADIPKINNPRTAQITVKSSNPADRAALDFWLQPRQADTAQSQQPRPVINWQLPADDTSHTRKAKKPGTYSWLADRLANEARDATDLAKLTGLVVTIEGGKDEK